MTAQANPYNDFKSAISAKVQPPKPPPFVPYRVPQALLDIERRSAEYRAAYPSLVK